MIYGTKNLARITNTILTNAPRDLTPFFTQMKQKMKVHKKRYWIAPANPKYYNLEKAFSESETILWKQSSHVSVGDLVYLYIAAPVSAIRYKCQAVEVDSPYQYDDGKVHMNHVMKLKYLEQYEQSLLTLSSDCWNPWHVRRFHTVFPSGFGGYVFS